MIQVAFVCIIGEGKGKEDEGRPMTMMTELTMIVNRRSITSRGFPPIGYLKDIESVNFR